MADLRKRRRMRTGLEVVLGGKKKKGGRGGRKKGDAAQFVQIIGLSKRKRNAKNAILTASTPHLDSARKAESIHSAPLKGTPPPPSPSTRMVSA